MSQSPNNIQTNKKKHKKKNKEHRNDKNKKNSEINIHYPRELMLNLDPKTKLIQDPPFKIIDLIDSHPRLLNEEEDYLFYDKNQKGNLLFLICITVYNETIEELKITLDSIYENVLTFTKRESFSEKQFMILIIFDGINHISESIEAEIFQKLERKFEVPVLASLESRRNIFRRDVETYLRVKESKLPLNSCYLYHSFFEKNLFNQKVKTLFSVKMSNGSKISSMVWLLRGYAEFIKPKYCVFADCGSILQKEALWKSFLALQGNKNNGVVYGMVIPKASSTLDESDYEILKNYDSLSYGLSFIFSLRSAQAIKSKNLKKNFI